MEETIHDNFFDGFVVATATLSAADDIPPEAGVYAFYHAFDFQALSLYEDINKRISSTVFKTSFHESEDRTKFIIDTHGESMTLSARTANFLKELSSPRERRNLKRLLLKCSFLQLPEYIGTTNNLKRRFLEHIEYSDGFLENYSQGRKQDEFLFVCLPCDRKISRELESILIQLSQPKVNSQRS